MCPKLKQPPNSLRRANVPALQVVFDLIMIGIVNLYRRLVRSFVDIFMNVLDSSCLYGGTYLYINVRLVLPGQIRAVRDNPTVIHLECCPR